jgi:hypothetical protein
MSGPKKKSWSERIRSVWGKPNKESEDAYERTMHKLGIDVLNDQKLEHRQKLMIQFEDYFKDEIKTENLVQYAQELKYRQDLLNHALYEISAPYGRAGDIPRFGKMFHGWGRLNASASSWILRTFDIVKQTEKMKATIRKETAKKEEPKAEDKTKKDEKVQEEQKEESPVERDELEEMLEDLELESIDPRILVHSLHDVLQKHIWKDGFLILGQCFLDRDISPRASTVIQNVNAQREREDMTGKPDF